MKKVFLLVALVLGSTAAQAASDYDKCIEELGDSMAAMKECAYRDFQTEDAKLNVAYKNVKNLFAELSRTETGYPFDTYKQLSQRLVAAQKAWIAFRDTDCELKTESIGGTLEGLEITGCQTEMTKERTEFLQKLEKAHRPVHSQR